jgi:hypothetical protein
MAIDASYAMGYVEQLFRTVANPGGGLKAMSKKLAKRFSQHWFKHARQSDLEDVRIYDSVRSRIALSYRSETELLVADQAAAMKPREAPLQFALDRATAVWS